MEYELECKVRRLAEETIDNYDRHLRYLRDYLEAEHNVDNLLKAGDNRFLDRHH